MVKGIFNKAWFHYLIVTLAAMALFIPFNGGVHLFDWDEINFAESAREMLVSGEYLNVQVNFESFWEKPPFYIWMQAASMKLFGINEFAARFPNAVCGIFTLLTLYTLGRKLFNEKFGLIWVIVYAGSFLPFVYFKSGIIDPWFNLFIFLSLVFVIETVHSKNGRLWCPVLSGLFLGIAVLTKGPVAVLIVLLAVTVYYFLTKPRLKVTLKQVTAFTVVLLFTGGLWFILQILTGNYTIISDFIKYQIRLFSTRDAGHGGFLLYHFVVILFGVFPASLPALPSFFKSPELPDSQKIFRRWMIILFIVVIILFTIVKTKIVHYSSLCYFPLTYLAAFTVYNIDNTGVKWKKILSWLLPALALIYATVTIVITFLDRYKDLIITKGWINDPFAVACLGADGGWKGYEFIAGFILLLGAAVFIALWKRKMLIHALISFFTFTCLFIFLAIVLVTPRVEQYSQNAAIEFFKSVSDEDAYLKTLGYKSYAHLFYGKIKPHDNTMSDNTEWLLTGDTDKTAYFAFKITSREKYLEKYPELTVIYEKNGFVFSRRNAVVK